MEIDFTALLSGLQSLVERARQLEDEVNSLMRAFASFASELQTITESIESLTTFRKLVYLAVTERDFPDVRLNLVFLTPRKFTKKFKVFENYIIGLRPSVRELSLKDLILMKKTCLGYKEGSFGLNLLREKARHIVHVNEKKVLYLKICPEMLVFKTSKKRNFAPITFIKLTRVNYASLSKVELSPIVCLEVVSMLNLALNLEQLCRIAEHYCKKAVKEQEEVNFIDRVKLEKLLDTLYSKFT